MSVSRQAPEVSTTLQKIQIAKTLFIARAVVILLALTVIAVVAE